MKSLIASFPFPSLSVLESWRKSDTSQGYSVMTLVTCPQGRVLPDVSGVQKHCFKGTSGGQSCIFFLSVL